MGDDNAGPGGKRERVLYGEGAAGPELELDLDLGKNRSNAPAPAESPGVASLRPRMQGSVVPMPRREPGVDKVEARLLARYPQVPSRFWELPGYARAVKARLAELEVGAAQREKKRAGAQAQLDHALVGIAQRAVALCKGLSRPARQPYAATLDRISSSEAHLRSIDGAHMSQMDASNEKIAALDKRLGPANSELEAARLEERRAAGGLTGGAKATPAEASALEEARKKVASAQGAVAILREERELEEAAKQRTAAHDPVGEAARAEYNLTCAEFAQFAMDDGINFGAEFAADRMKITNLRDVAASAEKEAILHRAAAESYDRDALAKAKNVLVGGIAGAAVLLLLILVLFLK